MSAFQAVRRGFDSHRPLHYSTGSVATYTVMSRSRGVVGEPWQPVHCKEDAYSFLLNTIFRGISSVDRAVALQASGRRFDPDILHH